LSDLEIFVSIGGLFLGYFIVSKLLESYHYKDTTESTTVVKDTNKLSGFRAPRPDEIIQKHTIKHGYLTLHWQGKLSLVRSFWINNVALNILLVGITSYWLYAGTTTEDPVFLARVVLGLSVFGYVFLLPWQIIGLWRSANNYISFHGKSFWPRVAKLIIILNILSAFNDITSESKFYEDMYHNSFMLTKEQNYKVNLIDNTIYLSGNLNYGISERVKDLLSLNSNVDSIVLESSGGLLYESAELSRLVLTRSLNTYTYNHCASACTIVFISGNRRYISSNARLGFHQYSYYRPSAVIDLNLFKEQVDDAKFFNRRGVKTEFTDKMYNAKSDDMWYPSTQELIKYGVIHEVVI
jgi:ATP-dependent protease ClpP protease subunit